MINNETLFHYFNVWHYTYIICLIKQSKVYKLSEDATSKKYGRLMQISRFTKPVNEVINLNIYLYVVAFLMYKFILFHKLWNEMFVKNINTSIYIYIHDMTESVSCLLVHTFIYPFVTVHVYQCINAQTSGSCYESNLDCQCHFKLQNQPRMLQW